MNITAKVLAHSISRHTGKHIITFECEYPRMIHQELLTHRMFARNCASSRAIPVKAMIQNVLDNTATPIHWGKNRAGMQAKEECVYLIDIGNGALFTREEVWRLAMSDAVHYARAYDSAGYHKQIVNRLLEPFQMMKTVITTTELANFLWLRDHEDAQPEIRALAIAMFEALKESTPVELNHGDWHVPYYMDGYWIDEGDGVDKYGFTAEDALKISASCCAQTSYRKSDATIEKANDLYKRLIESEPVHASPVEHQATPYDPDADSILNEGVTHIDVGDGGRWSGNFRNWIQYRKLIPNNCKKSLDWLDPYFK